MLASSSNYISDRDYTLVFDLRFDLALIECVDLLDEVLICVDS